MSTLRPALERYLAPLADEAQRLAPARLRVLRDLAAYVHGASSPARLLFLCTHNSRRSHFAQAWAACCATYAGLGDRIVSLSGGTQATAFNPRAVRALADAGFDIETEQSGDNPRYRLRYGSNGESLMMYSKRLDAPENRASPFAAVMTCSDADEACPVIPGAAVRIPLTYEDPKVADDTSEERQRYAQRCRQIATEMAWVFREVASRAA